LKLQDQGLKRENELLHSELGRRFSAPQEFGCRIATRFLCQADYQKLPSRESPVDEYEYLRVFEQRCFYFEM
jgi:hypothetical protein